MADVTSDRNQMCAAKLRGIRRGERCPNRASLSWGGIPVCGTHARLAALGNLDVPEPVNAAAEREARQVSVVEDALFDMLDGIVSLPNKQWAMMALEIVRVCEVERSRFNSSDLSHRSTRSDPACETGDEK